MRRRVQFASALMILLTVVAQAGVVGAESVGQDYIVVFEEDTVAQISDGRATTFPPSHARKAGLTRLDRQKVADRVSDIRGRLRVQPKNVFDNAIGGFSATLTPSQLARVQADPDVAFVTPDVKVSLADEGNTVLAGEEMNAAGIRITGTTGDRLPAGVVRVGATRNAIADIDGRDSRVNADIAILDTGVDRNHPDLNVAGGYNCTTSNRGAWGDEHGHGTHVSGTAAALDNGRGVVGVAPGARIWSVKVLNKQGTGYLSWLVCGINWVTAQKDSSAPSGQRIEVANMSLRFGLPGADNRSCGIPAKDAVHQAICRSVGAGVTYAVAAGNDERNARVYRPAAYPAVITVSAIADYDGKPGGLARQADYCGFYSADADDTFANFSNYGAVVDLTAPGKCVVSTYPGNRYAWMSGTSMATPHVAGGAALYRVRYPNAQPGQVKMALQNVGRLDWKTGTDPDNSHERVLWLGTHSAPPEFELTGASAPSGWLGQGSRVSVSVSRSHGHNASIQLSLRDAPAGLTGSGTFGGNSGSLTLHVQPGTASGTHRVTVRATDGELVSTRKVDVRIDGSYPSAGFDSPSRSLTVQNSNKVLVAWDESDSGSGISGRTLQRQRGTIRTPGTCDGVSYSNVGSAETRKDDYLQSLTVGYCYRWVLRVRDNAGNTTTVTSGSVLIPGSDSDSLVAPTVSAPQPVILSGSQVTTSGLVRIQATWSGASSVTGYELRYSRNGGSWSKVGLADSDSTRAVLKLPGGRYVLAARGRDAQGNWSRWSASPAFTLGLVQSQNKATDYDGKWASASITKTLGGLVTHSSQAGARATFTFSGRQVAIVGLTASNRGRADVYVNGKLRATVNFRSSSTVKRTLVFSRSWAKSATRTLEVRLHGGARIDLDAFVVLR